jgi:hypothetical protein
LHVGKKKTVEHVLVRILQLTEEDVLLNSFILRAELKETPLKVDLVIEHSRGKAMGRLGRGCRTKSG